MPHRRGVVNGWSLVMVVIVLSAFLLAAVAKAEPTRLNGSELKTLIKHQFVEFDPLYAAHREKLEADFEEMQGSMLARMSNGQALPCSYQIATEIEHFLHYTCEFAVVEDRLRDLNASLSRNQSADVHQQLDGSWAGCTDVLHVKLGLTQDQLYPFFLANRSLKRPLKFVAESALANVTTLIPYLTSLLISDIATDGVNRRQELNSVLTFVSKLVSMRPWADTAGTGLLLSDAYVSAYRRFLQSWQGVPGGAGSWGARYTAHAGPTSTDAARVRPLRQLRFADDVFGAPDLSITFHVTKYWLSNATPCDSEVLHSAVSSSRAAGIVDAVSDDASDPTVTNNQVLPFRGLANLTRVVLDNRYQPYPYGWGVPGSQNSSTTVWDNHNDFDVCTLLGLGWHTLSGVRQQEASEAVGRMVAWAVGPQSINRVGRRTLLCDGQDSIGDCYYFTVAFLDVIGYWDVGKQFWRAPAHFHDVELCERLLTTMVGRLGFTEDTGIGWSAVLVLRRYCSAT